MYIYWTWWQSTINGFENMHIYEIDVSSVLRRRYAKMMSKVIQEYPIIFREEKPFRQYGVSKKRAGAAV